MRRKKIVLSGSGAPDVMDPSFDPPPNDLDIFIPSGLLIWMDEYVRKNTDYVEMSEKEGVSEGDHEEYVNADRGTSSMSRSL